MVVRDYSGLVMLWTSHQTVELLPIRFKVVITLVSIISLVPNYDWRLLDYILSGDDNVSREERCNVTNVLRKFIEIADRSPPKCSLSSQYSAWIELYQVLLVQLQRQRQVVGDLQPVQEDRFFTVNI